MPDLTGPTPGKERVAKEKVLRALPRFMRPRRHPFDDGLIKQSRFTDKDSIVDLDLVVPQLQ
jgi:hypothetical protein